MATLIKNINIIDTSKNINITDDILITPEVISISPSRIPRECLVLKGKNKILVPGLLDLHVHFREPGFTHKEDISSGIRAALRGGVTSALVMPNTKPAIDNPKQIYFQKNRAQKSGFDLLVAAAATLGLSGEYSSDISSLKQAGALAITDDGLPIADAKIMSHILRECRKNNLICMQHAEDLKISNKFPMNLGAMSAQLGIGGQSKEAEFGLIDRDINLVEQIGARYHVLHMSCKESVELVRRAQQKKLPVSGEVTPHHLFLTDKSCANLDTNKKMNPPLRTKQDIEALLTGIHDGTIDAVASDHAPHSYREKKLDFNRAPFGVVGVETAFLVLLTLVQQRKLSLSQAIYLMTTGPAKILQQEDRIGTLVGDKALKNTVIFDPKFGKGITERSLSSQSRNSAFFGEYLFGRIEATFLNGNLVYRG